jgi:tRNA (guanine37-N1)-methyltransferase
LPRKEFAIISVFPEIFASFLATSLIKRAILGDKIAIKTFNLRDYSTLPHRAVDDTPYGGGAGMVLRPEPWGNAITAVKKESPNGRVVFLSPSGFPLTQRRLGEMAIMEEPLILLCGRYEGIDQRVIDLFVDEEISIGDYVTMGGEVPAMVLLEGVIRLIPGVLRNAESLTEESFITPMLEAPKYTKPPVYNGKAVPPVLLSGNHEEIAQFRKVESDRLTFIRRPDLYSDG